MKHTIKFLAILAATFLLISCGSRPELKEPFTVDQTGPKIELGTIDVFMDRALGMGGLRTFEVTVEYFPIEDAVNLQYRTDMFTYNQFWDKEGRDAFLDGLEKYKEDFEARNLSRKGNARTKRNYGTVQGYLIWYMGRFTSVAKGNPDMQIGYFVRGIDGNRVSFFTVTQRGAYFLDPVNRDNSRESPEIMFYFTRLQADELAALFDQTYLDSLEIVEEEERGRRRIFDFLN